MQHLPAVVNKHLPSFLFKLISLAIVFNISSCDCGNMGTATPTKRGDKNIDKLHEQKKEEQKKNGEQNNEQKKEDQKKNEEQNNEQKKEDQKKNEEQNNEQKKEDQKKNEEQNNEQKKREEQERVNQAIQDLEKEAAKPGADPKLKTIYEIIRALPPIQILVNLDKTESRINTEKNGQELLDKIIDRFEHNELMRWPTSEAINWLIQQNLLTPQEIQEQGSSYLERTVLPWINSTIPLPTAEAVVNTLVGQGAKLSPANSSALLEKLIEAECTIDYPREDHEAIFDFLKNQGPQLSPEKASQLLEKLINQLSDRYQSKKLSAQTLKEFMDIGKKVAQLLKEQGGKIPLANALDILGKTPAGLPQELEDFILAPIQENTAVIEPSKATALLQQAVEKGQGPKVYGALLDRGADPNIMVKDGLSGEVPLLQYMKGKRSNPGYQEFFQKLLNNPNVQINKPVKKYNHPDAPLAMHEAYEHNGTTEVVEALLGRNDLDLNTIQSQDIATKNYTLLDILVQDCMMIPSGHDWQQEKIVENNKRWLAILNKMKTHPNFKITLQNLKKAEENYEDCKNGSKSSAYKKEVLDAALEALNIVKNGPKQN